jgi:runt-related transcription factor 2
LDDADSTTVGPATSSGRFTTSGPSLNATIGSAVSPTTLRPTKIDELTVQRKQQQQQQQQQQLQQQQQQQQQAAAAAAAAETAKAKPPRVTPNDLESEETSRAVSVVETSLCDCPEIEVTSKVTHIHLSSW